MRKFICMLVIVLIISTGFVGYAAIDNSISVKDEVGIGAEYSGKIVTIDVFAEGKTAADLFDGNGVPVVNPETIIFYRDQAVTGINGTYTFSFKLNGTSGMYKAYVTVEDYVTGEGVPVVITHDIDFVNVERFTEAVGKINGIILNNSLDISTKPGLVSAEVATYQMDLGILGEWTTRYNALNNKSRLAEILISLMGPTGFSIDESDNEIKSDIAAMTTMMEKAILVEMLNEGKLSNVFDFIDLLEIGQGDLAGADPNGQNGEKWYNATFMTQALQTNMTGKLSNCNLVSFDTYRNKIVEAFVLAAVQNPNGYLNAKNVVTNFATQIGINVTGTEGVDVWTTLSGLSFASYGKLKEKFVELTGFGGGGGGGTSGGGGSSTNDTDNGTAIIPIDPSGNDKPQPIVMERFSDVGKDHWAFAAINELSDKGYINGYDDGNFKPEANITREEFVKLIVGCFEDRIAEEDIQFTDVSEDDWFYEYVKFAVANGIINGENENSFGTGKNITRQDIATIVFRALGVMENLETVDKPDVFNDEEQIADYAKEAVYSLRNAGIISGMPGNKFEPDAFATRAQAATILNNLLNRRGM